MKMKVEINRKEKREGFKSYYRILKNYDINGIEIKKLPN
jgi:hypothetical protein